MKLSSEFINSQAKIAKTPFLLTDLNRITYNYNRLQKALPGTIIHYSIKSNNDPHLITHLNHIGSHFDVATWEEIKLTRKLQITPNKLVYSTPIKKAEYIDKAYNSGIRQFAFDSDEEVKKIAKYAPQSQVILRILVESEGSQCPMFKKFGVYIDEAYHYLKTAIDHGLKPIGLTFHVGSQCTVSENWIKALARANRVWDEARKAGIQLTLVNLGGGLPVSYDENIAPLETYTKTIRRELKKNFKGLTHTYIEPGRYMTDEASVMVSTVIGKARRYHTEWIYLDVGGFNGLFEIFEGFKYDIQTLSKRKSTTYAVGGPTCDGMDVIRKSIIMPKVNVGDRVFIMNAGAYSISKEKYNGFKWAKSYIAEND